MKYNSKLDAYNLIGLITVIVILTLPNFFFEFSWVYFSFMLVFDLIFILFMFGLSYELSERELVVKLGFFKFGVSYERIKEITLESNLFVSSCATSVKQIKITFGNNFVLRISPDNEVEFLNNITKNCPQIKEVKNKRK